MVTPERYKTYRAIVQWHSPPSNKFFPDHVFAEDGAEVIVSIAWLMDEQDPFPGEFAVFIQPAHDFWAPQRDFIFLEEVERPRS